MAEYGIVIKHHFIFYNHCVTIVGRAIRPAGQGHYDDLDKAEVNSNVLYRNGETEKVR